MGYVKHIEVYYTLYILKYNGCCQEVTFSGNLVNTWKTDPNLYDKSHSFFLKIIVNPRTSEPSDKCSGPCAVSVANASIRITVVKMHNKS